MMKLVFLAIFSVFFPTSALERRQENNLTSQCIQACSRLARNSSYTTHYPGNGDVTVWDEKQQNVQSACRVEPHSSEDVADILGIILDTSCQFAVKSGGHAREPDDSVSVGGVTIDLQRMKTTEVSPSRSRAKLGAGHTLHSAYVSLEKYNLTTLGGRADTVGLGGYTLGGGLSHLSPVYGLAKDNVFEYEVVLPNATVATVNEHTHPDLYFALRGGMNNFGIVTYFTMRTVDQGRFYAGQKTYSSDKRDAIIKQAYDLTTTWKNDTAMAFYYDFGYNQTTDDYTIAFTQEYSRPILNPPPFRELNQIPSESSTIRLDWATNFSVEVGSKTPPGDRNLFSTVTYYPSPDLDHQIQDIMLSELQSVKGASGFFPNLVTQPIYESAIHASKERGGSAAGIDADGPLTVVLLIVRWDNASDDDSIVIFSNNWVEKATAAARKAGKHHPWLYINYANKDQDPYGGYGQENLQRLRRIQRSVDPDGVFTSRGLCRGYFKLL